jgi:GGDEF domain-containing protein
METKKGGQVFEVRIVKVAEDRVLVISRDITEQKEHLERIEFLSFRDQLTGLYNRRFFEEELARLDSLENLPLCVLIADVNGLKIINDSFGHQAGDQILIKTASVLKRTVKKQEIFSGLVEMNL